MKLQDTVITGCSLLASLSIGAHGALLPQRGLLGPRAVGSPKTATVTKRGPILAREDRKKVGDNGLQRNPGDDTDMPEWLAPYVDDADDVKLKEFLIYKDSVDLIAQYSVSKGDSGVYIEHNSQYLEDDKVSRKTSLKSRDVIIDNWIHGQGNDEGEEDEEDEEDKEEEDEDKEEEDEEKEDDEDAEEDDGDDENEDAKKLKIIASDTVTNEDARNAIKAAFEKVEKDFNNDKVEFKEGEDGWDEFTTNNPFYLGRQKLCEKYPDLLGGAEPDKFVVITENEEDDGDPTIHIIAILAR